MLNSTRLLSACECCPQPIAGKGVSRRDVLRAGAAVIATASMPSSVFAQAKPHRIDVHHHIAPPSWLAAMDIIGRADFPLKNWSIQKTLDDMDKAGIATSMTSPTTPQVTPLGQAVGVRIAREANEYAKKMVDDHPGRFGVWAMLPLPHIDDSLKEIAYAFDTLKVDGVGCMTSYGDKWLGSQPASAVVRAVNRFIGTGCH